VNTPPSLELRDPSSLFFSSVGVHLLELSLRSLLFRSILDMDLYVPRAPRLVRPRPRFFKPHILFSPFVERRSLIFGGEQVRSSPRTVSWLPTVRYFSILLINSLLIRLFRSSSPPGQSSSSPFFFVLGVPHRFALGDLLFLRVWLSSQSKALVGFFLLLVG